MKDVRSQLARQLQEARPHEAAPPLPKTATGRPSLEGGDLQERRHGVDGIVGAAQAQGHRRVLAVVGLLLLCAALVGMLWRRRSLSPTTPTTVPASVSVPVSVPAVAVAPDGDALSPDPLVGKWEVRGGPDLRLRFLTDFQADGTTETVVLPETIAEMRRLKLPLPKMTVDHGRWTRDEKGEYRITHRMGATIQFTVNGDQFIGANAAGDVTTGSRVVSSGAPRSPPADAGQKDPVLGKWLIRSGPELSIILHVEYRPDGTALTTFPPETLAEIRKRKLLVPRENPDVGVWVQDSPGEYRHSFSGGRTVRFTVDRNAFRGRNPMGDRLVGLRQVTEEDPPSTE